MPRPGCVRGEPQTGLGGLGEAAAPLPALSHYCLCAIHVRPRPLAEGDAVRRAVKDSKLGAADALKRLAHSSPGGGPAIDPESQRPGAIEVGPRPLTMAHRGVYQVVHVLAADCVPLCLTGGGQRVDDRAARPLRAGGAATAAAGARSHAAAALDAAVAVALCARGAIFPP